MSNLPAPDKMLEMLLSTELVYLDRTYDLVPTDTLGYVLRIVHQDGTLISSEEYNGAGDALDAFNLAVQDATLEYILESTKSA